MARIFKILPVVLLFLLLGARSLAAFPEDDEDKKKADAEREKKAFDALITKAEEEYRVFFPKPEKVHQFWAAMKFEMETGKYDLAGLHLKLMLQLFDEKTGDPEKVKAAKEELVKLADRETLSAFTNLKTVRVWSIHEPYQKEAEKNVDDLLDLVRKMLSERLSNPALIRFFIVNLNAKTPEEQEFALVELRKRKELILPYLIDALRADSGTPLGDRILEFMVAMDDEMMGPLMEIFKVPFPEPGDEADKKKREDDARDRALRPALMQVIKARNDIRRAKGFSDDARVVPYLWHLAGTPKTKTPRLPYDDGVRRQARDLLVYFLKAEPSRLPKSEVVLTEMAERIYRGKDSFKGKKQLWRWNSETLKPEPFSPATLRLVFAQRYAKEALDLTPDYRPAQVVLLSLQMELLYETGPGKLLLDGPFPEWSDFDDVLARVDQDLFANILEKALDEKNLPVALGAVRALGRRGDAVAGKVVPPTPARGLVRALDYPDRRVQWAALQAILRMPGAPPPVVSHRLLDLLRRHLKTSAPLQALVVGASDSAVPKLKYKVRDDKLDLISEKEIKDYQERLDKVADKEAFLKLVGDLKEWGEFKVDLDKLGEKEGLAPAKEELKDQIQKEFMTWSDFKVDAERKFKDAFAKLKDRADFDLILLHGNLGLEEFSRLVNQLRADLDLAMIPVLVLSPTTKVDALTKDREEKERLAWIKIIENRARAEMLKKIVELDAVTKEFFLREKLTKEVKTFYAKETARRIAVLEDELLKEKVARSLGRDRALEERVLRMLAHQPLVSVVPELHLGIPEEYRNRVKQALLSASGPPLTALERELFQKQALGHVKSMATGEAPGYPVAATEAALLELAFSSAASEALARIAVETLSHFPGTKVQEKLAILSLDPTHDKIRVNAAKELNFHIRKNGFLLGKGMVKDIRTAHAKEADFTMKEQLALVLGAVGTSPRITGDTLFELSPTRPAPVPIPIEKKGKVPEE